MKKLPIVDLLPEHVAESGADSDVHRGQTDLRGFVDVLRERIRCLEGARPVDADQIPLESGCAALDRLLPQGGFPRGSLIEWIAGEDSADDAACQGGGTGAETLSMIAARQACIEGGALVVMDRRRCFYPPAAAALGVDLDHVIVVRARREQEELWAIDQALRCEGVAAVWAPLEKIDEVWFRRLQLAAESGQGLGLLVRPPRALRQPSWSRVQLLVEPRPSQRGRRLYLKIAKCRGRAGQDPTGRELELEMDEVTGVLREVDELREGISKGNARPAVGFGFGSVQSIPGRTSPAAAG